MKLQSWKLQPSMPPCSTSEFNIPSFLQGENLNYGTWYCDNYENDILYGEPLSAYQEDSFYESDSPPYWDRGVDENGVNYQAYGGVGDWLGEYISRLVGCWRDDMFSNGAFDNIYSGLQMEEFNRGDEQFDGCYSHDGDKETQCSYDHDTWFCGGFGFGFGIDKEEYDSQEHKLSYTQSTEEMALFEKLFGPWPCVPRPALESCVESGLS